jgi:plastocyanin
MSDQAPDKCRQGVDYKETADVLNLHAVVRREKREPRIGLAPLSTWLVAVCSLAIFSSGFYFGRYSGEFSGESLDPGGANDFSGPPARTVAQKVPANEANADNGSAQTRPAASATVTIMIRNMKFEPAKMEVWRGDVVEWKNDDITPHTATAALFDSGSIDPEKSWRYTVREAGTFPYGCTFHPDMKGAIVVK